jgi:thiamine biosynthesis protein ThiI
VSRTTVAELGQSVVLIHLYHEIALKGNNRPFFLNRLLRNLERALVDTGSGRIQRRSMMALLPLLDHSRWPQVKARLEQVIGVERFRRALKVPPTMDAIKSAIENQIRELTPRSFRITAHRTDKHFPLSSPKMNEELGAFVQQQTGLPVDLSHPDLEIHVTVLPKEALVSVINLPGPGGLPVGVSGKVAVMMSGGIDSPVAAYQMMTRGCPIMFIHFHSFPLVEGTSREKAVELVQLLTHYQLTSQLLLVPFAEVQKHLILSVPPAYRVILYRRFMIRIAEALAVRYGAGALVTGESLGQVSSQTLENLSTIEAARKDLPILRPLIGMDKEEITRRARSLESYPISIIPDQDCCSLFIPKHPVIRSNPKEVEQMESQIDVDRLVQTALQGVEERMFSWPR